MHQVGELADREGGLRVERGEVDLLVRHGGRPAFHPSGAFGVFVEAVAIGIVSAGEGVGLLDLRPSVGGGRLGRRKLPRNRAWP